MITPPPPKLPPTLKETPFATPEAWSGCGEGWWPLLEDVHDAMNGAYEVVQWKQKLGMLSIYGRALHPEDQQRWDQTVSTAARASVRTCELCGQPGERRSAGGWMQTLCDQHHRGHKPAQEKDR